MQDSSYKLQLVDAAVARKRLPLNPMPAMVGRHGKSRRVRASMPASKAKTFPLVSVIVPAYNAAAFIARTLASVRAQTYPCLEVLVIDDGSSDRTPQIVQTIAQQDPRVRLLQQPNAGVAAARNLGIQQARGEFIAPIDADDLWHPKTIEKIIARFSAGSPEVGVVYAWSVDIDEHGQQTGGFHAADVNGNVYRTLVCHNFLGNASSTLIRKACLERVGGYNPQLKAKGAQGCEDWELYLRLADRYEFEVVPEFLVSYRKVSSGLSHDFRQMARSQQLMLSEVEHSHPELPSSLYRLSRSSFYLYLAHQCDDNKNAQAALFWLKQAIKADPVTPLGRLGLYMLAIKNSARRLSEKRGSSAKRTVSSSAIPNQSCFSATTNDNGAHCSEQALLETPKPAINRLAICLKVFVGRLLHQSLSRL